MARKIVETTAAPETAPCEATGSAESLRERIMQAAFSLFMERGYADTSTLAIASRAKVSKRDIYALFPHKQDILIVAVAERARRMRLPLQLPTPRSRRALAEALAAHGTAVLRELTAPEVAAVFRLAIAESGRSRELADALDSSGRRPGEAALGEFLARAQAARLLGEGDPPEMVRQFQGLLLGGLHVPLLLRVLEAPDAAAIGHRARAAADALLAIYRVRRRPAPARPR